MQNVELFQKAVKASFQPDLPVEVKEIIQGLLESMEPGIPPCPPLLTLTLRGKKIIVEIFDSVDQLRNEARNRFQAVNEKGGALTVRVGEDIVVFFARDTLLIDVVSHEAHHVAMEVFDRKIDSTDESEEEFAETSAEFVRLFWNHVFGLSEEFHILLNHHMFFRDFIPGFPPPINTPDISLSDVRRMITETTRTASEATSDPSPENVKALAEATYNVLWHMVDRDNEARAAENKCQQWIKLTGPILEYGHSKESKMRLGQSIFNTILERAKKWDLAQTSTDK